MLSTIGYFNNYIIVSYNYFHYIHMRIDKIIIEKFFRYQFLIQTLTNEVGILTNLLCRL